MSEYFALAAAELPATLLGTDGDYTIRRLSDDERLAIEDHFFRTGVKLALTTPTTAVIVPQKVADATLEDFAVLVEFALGVVTVSGFQPVRIVATLNASTLYGGGQPPDEGCG